MLFMFKVCFFNQVSSFTKIIFAAKETFYIRFNYIWVYLPKAGGETRFRVSAFIGFFLHHTQLRMQDHLFPCNQFYKKMSYRKVLQK